MEAYSSPSAIYSSYVTAASSSFSQSARLGHPALRTLWLDLLALGLTQRNRRLHLPSTISLSTFRSTFPAACLRSAPPSLLLARQPSWLTRNLTRRVLLTFYDDSYTWTSAYSHLLTPTWPAWSAAHRLFSLFIRRNSLAIALWTDCTTVLAMIEVILDSLMQ